MKLKNFCLLALCLLCANHQAFADDKDEPVQRWAIQAGFGGTTLYDNTPDGQDFYMNDEEGNYFSLSADYFLNDRLALTGGLYYAQEGIATYLASGIGLKKVNMLGVEGGIKWYFFPKKWIVQPHIGALLQTNCLNLGRMRGSERHELSSAYSGSHVQMDYDVQCPALAFKPRIGADIHLFSTVSLCVAYDLSFGFWGHHRADMRFLDLPMTGEVCHYKTDNMRSTFSLGVKVDFPTKSISPKTFNNLLYILSIWIESKARH